MGTAITRKVCVCVTLDGRGRSVRWRKASVSIPPVPTMENVSTESVCVLLLSRAITVSKVQLPLSHTRTHTLFIKTFSPFDGLDSFLDRKIEFEAQRNNPHLQPDHHAACERVCEQSY